MKKFLALLVFLFTLTPFLHTLAHEGEEHFTILMIEDGFAPTEIVIPVGSTITFENVDSKDRWPASNIHPTHEIYSEFDPLGPVPAGESWSFQFDKAGVWKFHDHIYANFVGTITVEGDGTSVQADEEVKEGGLFERISEWLGNLFSSILSVFKTEETIAIEKDSTEIFTDNARLEAYIQKYGPAQTIKHLNELSSQFGSCHDPAHVAGRISYELLGEKAFRDCSAECHSGCYHGATEAYFKEHGTENIAENLQTLCSQELNSFFSHQCLHGIGHGLMAWANYEIFDALEACDSLPEGDSSCWSGVFMENVVGGLTDEGSGHFTKYLSDDPHYPCTVVDEKYKSSCYFFQTSRMVELFTGDFSKVAQACLEAPETHRNNCFGSMGRDVGGFNRKNPEGAIEDCSSAPKGQFRTACLMGAAQDSFWDSSGQDDAISFCTLLDESTEKGVCYNTMFVRARQVLESESAIRDFCFKVEEEYQAECFKY